MLEYVWNRNTNVPAVELWWSVFPYFYSFLGIVPDFFNKGVLFKVHHDSAELIVVVVVVVFFIIKKNNTLKLNWRIQ